MNRALHGNVFSSPAKPRPRGAFTPALIAAFVAAGIVFIEQSADEGVTWTTDATLDPSATPAVPSALGAVVTAPGTRPRASAGINGGAGVAPRQTGKSLPARPDDLSSRTSTRQIISPSAELRDLRRILNRVRLADKTLHHFSAIERRTPDPQRSRHPRHRPYRRL